MATMERGEGWYGVGNGLDRGRVNATAVPRGPLVPVPQIEQGGGCRRQNQDETPVVPPSNTVAAERRWTIEIAK